VIAIPLIRKRAIRPDTGESGDFVGVGVTIVVTGGRVVTLVVGGVLTVAAPVVGEVLVTWNVIVPMNPFTSWKLTL
jgi:hypothetical protein